MFIIISNGISDLARSDLGQDIHMYSYICTVLYRGFVTQGINSILDIFVLTINENNQWFCKIYSRLF